MPSSDPEVQARIEVQNYVNSFLSLLLGKAPNYEVHEPQKYVNGIAELIKDGKFFEPHTNDDGEFEELTAEDWQRAFNQFQAWADQYARETGARTERLSWYEMDRYLNSDADDMGMALYRLVAYMLKPVPTPES